MGMTLRIVRRETRGGNAPQARTGLAAWLLTWSRGFLHNGLAGIRTTRAERRMELVETLQLGGKRQLMLVTCDGQRYLVGAGGDSVHSIATMQQQTVGSSEKIGCAR